MEEFLYTCEYCSKQFEPKRRGHQIYCSNSCRSKAFRKKKQEESGFNPQLPTIQNNGDIEAVPSEIYEPPKQQVEKMSVAGVGNAAAGTALVDLAKNLFTPEEHKSATKKDINELKSLITGNRYIQIKNLPIKNGQRPYLDIETRMVVYF